MNNPNDIDALLSSGGAPSFFRKETPIGASVTGTVIEISGKQNTDYITGDPQTWDDGRPQMMIAITLQTQLRDSPEDDGKRGLYIKTWGAQAQALKDAVKAAGGTTAGQVIRPGATITATFTGETPSKAGSPTKLYSYQIVPGAVAVLDHVGGQPTAPFTPQVSQPAVQPLSAPAPVAAPDPWAGSPQWAQPAPIVQAPPAPVAVAHQFTPAPVVAPLAPAQVAAAPVETPLDKAKQMSALGVPLDQIAVQLGLDPIVTAQLIAA